MTLREYDAKEKERLYGISRQIVKVGAVRGIISLATIFFIALSAQASARTYIECSAEGTIY